MTQSFYQSSITSIATCYYIKLNNNRELRFTTHHQNLFINDKAYLSTSNIETSAISKSIGLNSDNLSISGVLTHQTIEVADIHNGLYDNAIIEIFQVDYTNPNDQQLHLQTGLISQIKLIGDQFIAEIHSVDIKTNQKIMSIYSPTCRALFGDAKCQVDKKNFTFETRLMKIINPYKLIIQPVDLSIGYFNGGIVKFASGDMLGITTHAINQLILAQPIPSQIKINDNISLISGCNKNFDECCNKFNNAINFRGEPNLPGLENIFRTTDLI